MTQIPAAANDALADPSSRPAKSTNLPDDAAATALPGDSERHQLPIRAIAYMQLQGLIFWGVPGVVATLLAIWWTSAPGWLRWSGPGVLLLIAVVDGFIAPRIRRRLFWYAISPAEVDLQHGWIVVKRTVLPMNRVQHLTVQQGPLASRFRLAKVSIHTAAGEVTMEPLDRQEAEQIRVRIAELARLSDDV